MRSKNNIYVYIFLQFLQFISLKKIKEISLLSFPYNNEDWECIMIIFLLEKIYQMWYDPNFKKKKKKKDKKKFSSFDCIYR